MALPSAVAFWSFLPLTLALPPSNSTASSEIAPAWVSNPNTRSSGDILYSCIITISLCVYTALHLNVPPRGTTKIGGLLRKAKWVVIGVFAPEIVVYTAFLQLRCVFKLWRAMKIICSKDVDNSKEPSDPEKGLAQKPPPTPVSINRPVSCVDGADLEKISDMEHGHKTAEISESKPHNKGKRARISSLASPDDSSIAITETRDHCIDGASAEEAQGTGDTSSLTFHEIELDEFRIRREEMIMTDDDTASETYATWTYAWYVVMGGFVLDVSPLHDYHGTMTLTHHAVLELAKDGLFLPMKKQSIRDKSKADFLAKGLVLCQVSFLIIQLIARKLQNLPVTLLEIHTSVHVVCALAMYCAWFGKPLDVQDPTRVDEIIWNNPLQDFGLKWQTAVAKLLVLSIHLVTWRSDDSNKEDVPLLAEVDLAVGYGQNSYPVARTKIETRFASLDKLQFSTEGLSHNVFTISMYNNIATRIRMDGARRPDLESVKDMITWNIQSNHDTNVVVSLTMGEAFNSRIGPGFQLPMPAGGYRDEVMVVPCTLRFSEKALRRWTLAFSDKTAFNAVICSPMDHISGGLSSSAYFTYLCGLRSSNAPGRSQQAYFEPIISNFASHSFSHDVWTASIAWLTCLAYGGIHAFGWDFTFATQAEELLWRISCPLLVILGVPVYELMRYFLSTQHKTFLQRLDSMWNEFWEAFGDCSLWLLISVFCRWLPLFCILPYFAARMFLVVEAFISMRHVAVGVYETVNWANYIPHL